MFVGVGLVNGGGIGDDYECLYMVVNIVVEFDDVWFVE